MTFPLEFTQFSNSQLIYVMQIEKAMALSPARDGAESTIPSATAFCLPPGCPHQAGSILHTCFLWDPLAH